MSVCGGGTTGGPATLWLTNGRDDAYLASPLAVIPTATVSAAPFAEGGTVFPFSCEIFKE